MWGALSDERTVLSFTVAVGHRQRSHSPVRVPWDSRRVCRLQLLLVLASPVILGSESRGTRDHILLSQIRDFPAGVLVM
jgi:hypothetical protein